jgi:UDP-N-acetyl-D-glucosamine dehydrogenase
MNLQESLEKIQSNQFTIEIFGLGYVGFPLAVKLASDGLKVTGIDIDSKRIERLKKNQLMDSEIYLKEEFLKIRESKNLELKDIATKTLSPKIGIICVPTPIPKEGLDSDIFVKSAVKNFLEFSKKGDIIILESSIEVGTTEKIQKQIEDNGYSVGENFGLCFCPERIDPQNKEWGIENIPRIIYCSDKITYQIAKKIYHHINNGNLIKVDSPRIAEVVKSFENAFRLVNISLVNELAILCDKLEINVKTVIDAAATKPFGFMPHYPGAGAGGHCIPKDPRFLLSSAKKFDVNFETIENALKINMKMPFYVCESIEKAILDLNKNKTVLVCGLAYKANVEDMRDSPSFKIIQELIKKEFKIVGYDPFFKKENLPKYLKENHLTEINFEILDDLDKKSLEGITCLCIVQHHEKIKEKLTEIYESGIVPCIYDCQSKLLINPKSKTKLIMLGD